MVRLQPTLAAVVAQKAALPQRQIDQAVEWLVEVITRRDRIRRTQGRYDVAFNLGSITKQGGKLSTPYVT